MARLNNLETQYDEAVDYGIALRKDNTEEIRMESGTTLPASPVAGSMFLNTDTKLAYFYNGAAWKTFRGALMEGPGAHLTDASWGALGDGNSICFDGTDTIYALRGGAVSFSKYSISGGGWTALTDAPAAIGTGACLVFTTGYIYTGRGGETNTFYRYDIAGNSWSTMTNITSNITIGSKAVYDGSDYIYLTSGNRAMFDKDKFYRYSISGNSWTALTDTPVDCTDDAAIGFDNDDTIFFTPGSSASVYEYGITAGTWGGSPMSLSATLPAHPSCFICSGSKIYILCNGTLWSYPLTGTTWTPVAQSYEPMVDNGDAVYIGDPDNFIIYTKGDGSDDLYNIPLSIASSIDYGAWALGLK